jgi:hypothetical protein
MHVLPTKMREFGHRSFSKDRVPLRPFRNRKLKNELFSSPLQSSAILSLMPIPPRIYPGECQNGTTSMLSKAKTKAYVISFEADHVRFLVAGVRLELTTSGL